MSIHWEVPRQARFIATSTIFNAVFNAIIPAKYDFGGTAANQDVDLIELQKGSVYLLERISAGGNVTEEQYLESVDTFPLLTVKRKKRKEIVYMKPIPIVNYFDGQECSAWVYSDKFTDFLTLSFSGILNQLPSMVGILTAKIHVSLSIYACDAAYFSSAFRDQLERTMGQADRR